MASRTSAPELGFTGERVVPGKTPRLLVLEHVVRYHFAMKFVGADSMVIDVGCGAGYGAAILAEKAQQVVGVDSAWEAIQYASRSCFLPNLHFACSDCRTLPFRDHSFDLAIMFEVIEHMFEQNICLSEIRRVLAPDGILILSTPNPVGPTKVIEEVNPFHKKELQQHELLELLRPHFGHVQLLYQHELSTSSIEPATSSNRSAEVVENFCLSAAPKYFVVLCSRQAKRMPAGRLLALGGIEHQIAVIRDLRQKEQDLIAQRRDIEALLQWREEKEQDYAQNLAAHDEVIARLKEEIGRLKEEITVRDVRLAQEGACRSILQEKTMELEWLYRWLPLNRLAHKLLYGKNLRLRILRRLRMRV